MFGIPFLPTSMGKGPLLDTHELAATVARSLAIGKCDVALVVGARLNWLLHFGEPPKWSKDVKFILVNVSKEEIELRKPHLAISSKVKDNVSKIEAQLAKEVVPFNFLTPMKIIRDAIAGLGSPVPILVSKWANTMNVASPDLLVVVVEGDSGFRFSAMEVKDRGSLGQRENSERKKVVVAFLAIGVIFSPKTFRSKSDGLKSPTLSTYLKLAHLLCFSTTFGATLWATFIGGIIMFKNLPRHQFGNLQSKMFPAYFTIVGICLAVSAGSFGYLHPWSSSSVADKYQLDFLLSASAFNLTNLFVFAPMTIETRPVEDQVPVESDALRNAHPLHRQTKRFILWLR
ncbi:hypothetical protein FF2_022767 [Malus domestica]